MALILIKLIHTIAFFVLSGCIFYILFCGITGRYSRKTTAAFVLIIAEGMALALNDWQCPLTTLAGKLGDTRPDVATLFLPPWLAEHLFGVCTPLFVGSAVLVLIRRIWPKR